MKSKLVKILIFIILFVFYVQYSFAATTSSKYYYQDKDKGILAYKEVNAFQLTLSDGSILSNSTLNTESSVNVEEILKKLQIVFVIDTSGSMAGKATVNPETGKFEYDNERLNAAKDATKTLIESLFTQIGEDHLEIGILYFNNGLDKDKVLDLTNNKDKVSEHLDKIYAGGGTQMADALKKAREMLKDKEETAEEDQQEDDKEVMKIVCTLSDGALQDEEKAIKEFDNIHNDKISTISIFVETKVTDAFNELAIGAPTLHTNFMTTDADLQNTIVNNIYNEIYQKIISMSNPQTTYNYNIENGAIIPGDDKIIFQVDNELLYGATLKVEYVISITTAFPTSNIKIYDFYTPPLNFNGDAQLLTENGKNSSYGWQVVDGKLMLNSGNQVQNMASEYKVKLLLSTVLSPEMVDDLNKIQNYMTFSLKNIDTNEDINIEMSSDGVNRIKALDFLIIPPTGEFDTKKESAYSGIMILIIALYTIVAFCIIHYIRKLKGRK